MGGVHLAPLAPDLLEPVARLVADLRTSMNGRVVCTPEDLIPVLKKALGTPSYHGALALIGEKPMGYIGWNDRFALYAGGAFGQVTELFVAPKARRLGLASLLLDHAQHTVRVAGGTSVEISIPPPDTHPGTLAFYAAHGYALRGPRVSKTL